MHEKAHAECSLSNSVITEVVVEPQDQEIESAEEARERENQQN
tara:strand:- start:301 stop:429 length:129 start_codon:yes stop_codon:yes gene_type:complete